MDRVLISFGIGILLLALSPAPGRAEAVDSQAGLVKAMIDYDELWSAPRKLIQVL